MTSLRQIVYVSRMTAPIRTHDERQILAISRRKNERYGITGLLACSEHHCIQVLEGFGQALQDTFARISADPRHEVRLLIDREVESRQYGNWSMAYVYNLDLRDELDAMFSGGLGVNPDELLARMHPDSQLGVL